MPVYINKNNFENFKNRNVNKSASVVPEQKDSSLMVESLVFLTNSKELIWYQDESDENKYSSQLQDGVLFTIIKKSSTDFSLMIEKQTNIYEDRQAGYLELFTAIRKQLSEFVEQEKLKTILQSLTK
jgi:hypothetical protein